jgi:hypothetical protein
MSAGVLERELRERALETLAQSVAREHGWLAIQSNKPLDNCGGFQLIDLRTREVIAGGNFQLSALDVLGICHESQDAKT